MKDRTHDWVALFGTALATARDGEDIEIFGEERLLVTADVARREVRSLSVSRTHGAAVRLFRGGVSGHAYTTGTTAAALLTAIRCARQACLFRSGGEPDVPPDGEDLVRDGWISSERGSGTELSTGAALALERARELDRHTLEASSEITALGECEVGWADETRVIVSTRRVSAVRRSTRSYAFVNAIAERRGLTSTGFASAVGTRLDDLDLPGTAREAAARAVSLLGAKALPAGCTPVVFDQYAGAQLVGSLVPVFDGARVSRGRSLLAGRVGEQIAPACLTLVDDPTSGPGRRSFDDEGRLTRRCTLVASGRLSGYLHTTRSGHALGDRPTGHAIRPSFKRPPSVANSTLRVVPGRRSVPEALEAVGTGIHVERVLGVGAGVDPIAGSVSFGLAGRRIQGGELGDAFDRAVLVTDLATVLASLSGVCDDLRFVATASGIGTPTLCFHDLPVRSD